jgi:archaetidylinositol phosphate synthase
MSPKANNELHMDVSKHKRANPMALGFLERPALDWLSRHLPKWVSPDMLTGLGFAAAILIGVSYWLSRFNHNFLWLASFGFLLNWFGDSLDGTLARKRNIERPKYGFFIDHTTDALGEVIIFIGLGLSGYVNLPLALVALIGYLLMSILVYISTYVSGTFRISYIKLGPTEMRAFAITFNTIIYFVGNPVIKLPFVEFHLYDAFIAAIIGLLYGGYIVLTIVKAVQLSKQESSTRK